MNSAIREITEDEAYELAVGANEWPVIVKEENDETKSAVCLKKFPKGYCLALVLILWIVFSFFIQKNTKLFLNCVRIIWLL